MSYELEAAKKQPLHRRPSCQAFCATIVESYQSFNQGDSVLAARRFASQNAGKAVRMGSDCKKGLRLVQGICQYPVDVALRGYFHQQYTSYVYCCLITGTAALNPVSVLLLTY